MELAGKTTLITGGGSGIGAETARYMAARGAAPWKNKITAIDAGGVGGPPSLLAIAFSFSIVK